MVKFTPSRPRDGLAPQYENDILAILSFVKTNATIKDPWMDVREIEKGTGVVYRRITRIFYMDRYNKGKAMPFIAHRYGYRYKLRKFHSRPGTFNNFKWKLSVV